MRPGALEQRIKDQDETLENALRFVKQGGRIVYITCSVLRAENEDRIAAFMARRDDLLPIDATTQANSAGLPALAEHRSTLGPGFRLSPRTTGTDGFYIATLARM
jgi:16S rRNA (cytosine967-C5)-methyltransferase